MTDQPEPYARFHSTDEMDAALDATTPSADVQIPAQTPASEEIRTQLPLRFAAIPAQAPDGQWVVQARIVVGPSAFILELPAAGAEQFAQGVTAQLTAAANAVRRANLGAPPGLILPGAPMPPNGHGRQ